MISTTMDGYIPKLEQAIMMSAEGHAGVEDKGGQPYVLHPIRVMLSMPPKDIVGRIVGVLHDMVEDTEVTLGTIATHFSSHVAEAIDALSRRSILAEEEAVARGMKVGDKEPYMQFIARLAKNEVAVRVKLMDIADNMRPERYIESITGLHGRYEKARDFLTAALLEFESRDTADFLLHTKMITADQYIKRISKLRLA